MRFRYWLLIAAILMAYGYITDKWSHVFIAGFVILVFNYFLGGHSREDGAGEKGQYIPAYRKRYVMKKQNGLCGWKGCIEHQYLKLHHRLPKNLGGDNRVSNLVYLCGKHHDMAHDPGTGKVVYGAVPGYLRGGFK